jgi:hypothetical protein
VVQLSNIPTLTLYTTIYSTITVPETLYLVAKYKIISEYVTQLDVDYYDDLGFYVTRIPYPTRYLKSVNTVFIGTETRTTPPIGAPITLGTGETITPPNVVPVPVSSSTPRGGSGSIKRPEPLPVTA